MGLSRMPVGSRSAFRPTLRPTLVAKHSKIKNPHNVFGNGDRQDGKRDGKSRLFENAHTKTVARRVGQKKAVAIAVRNVSGRRRWSKLHEWLASKK
jgi:hypothetical protein